MVSAGDIDSHADKSIFRVSDPNLLQGVPPDGGVGLHDLPLQSIKLPRLEQDIVRNAHLANIMQR